MGNHLNGKVAIVTGGASGLGLAFTEILAGEGAQVIVADLSEECGRSAAEQVNDRGGKCFFK